MGLIKQLRISKKIIFIVLLIIPISAFCSLLSCKSNKKIISNVYPNTVAENAQINNQYKDKAKSLTEFGINEFMENISKIPRPSGHVDQIRQYIYNWGISHNIQTTLDKSGCVYMDLPATAGCEKFPNVVLQAHMDMVGVSTDKSKDMTKTPIDLVYDKDSGEIHSKNYETTIGADDAEGLITLLSIAQSKDIAHGPVRLLFTYDEETTMQGIKDVDESVLNANYLINVDHSYAGSILYLSAGTIISTSTNQYNLEQISNATLLSVEISNLTGGHSGVDIVKPRIHAIKFQRELLNKLKEENIKFYVAELNGGKAANSIPASSNLKFYVDAENVNKVKDIIENYKNEILKENSDDAEANIQIKQENSNIKALNFEKSCEFLDVLNKYVIGVIEEDKEHKDVPIASNNIGIIKFKDGNLLIKDLIRASEEKYLDDFDSILTSIKNNYGYKYEINLRYPAWKGSVDARFTQFAKQAYLKTSNIEPSIDPTHAVLETSYLFKKKLNANIISIGADVKDEHAVTETLYTKSFPFHIAAVIYMLENIGNLE